MFAYLPFSFILVPTFNVVARKVCAFPFFVLLRFPPSFIFVSNQILKLLPDLGKGGQCLIAEMLLLASNPAFSQCWWPTYMSVEPEISGSILHLLLIAKLHVTAWRTISWDSRSPLSVLQGSLAFCTCVNDIWSRWCCLWYSVPQVSISQKNNALPHTVRHSQQYLQGYDLRIKVLPWPTISSNLAPI